MISAELRRTVRTLYAFTCGYCGITETEVGAYLTIDHYQPVDAGGSDDVDNLVYACHACNLHKSNAWNLLDPPILHPLRTYHLNNAGELAENRDILISEHGDIKTFTPTY